jgi:hypothetical protein
VKLEKMLSELFRRIRQRLRAPINGSAHVVVLKWQYEMLRLAVGALQHDLMGPMQGLRSTCRFLAHGLAGRVGDRLINVQREAELIVSVFEYHRWGTRVLLAGGAITPQSHLLWPIVEECVRRYTSVFHRTPISLVKEHSVIMERANVDEAAIGFGLTPLLEHAMDLHCLRTPIIVRVDASNTKSSRRARIWVDVVGRTFIDDPQSLTLNALRWIAEAHAGRFFTEKRQADQSGALKETATRLWLEIPLE